MDLSCKPSYRGNVLVDIMSRCSRQRHDDERKVLVLNVLLLGNRQSGRSSVGNALIGGYEFQTGASVSDVSVTTQYQVLSRNYPRYFRRQGAESDLTLRVIDTPPLLPYQQTVHELCPEGVHVLLLVVRADLPQETPHLEQHLETLFGPEWCHHTFLILTHTDQLERAGLQLSLYLTQATDWLRALAQVVDGRISFLDNSCDWPLIRGRPLIDQLLTLSARNHHRALKARTEVSL